MVWLAFNAGGFFAGTIGLAAAGTLIALVLWFTGAPRPLGALTPWLGAATGALALLALWMLASATWSDASARALLEFDRALLYLGVLVLAGLTAATDRRRRALLQGLALAGFVVAAAGLTSRVRPDIIDGGDEFQADRLAYPVTYWNGLGLVMVLAILACIHLTTSEREPRAVRILGAAAVPVLATTLYFTFSRGAMVLLPLGVVVYLVLARPRGVAGGLIAVLPSTAVSLVAAFGSDALSGDEPTGAAALAEGRDLAPLIVACVVGAALLRFAALPLDELAGRWAERARSRVRGRPRAGRLVPVAVAAALVLVVGGLALATGAPDWVSRQYDGFIKGPPIDPRGDQRDRLAKVSSNGRLDHWRVAVDSSAGDRLKGTGAGTYEHFWARDRPTRLYVVDAHSLYVESLGELGIVGLLLVVAFVLILLGGSLRLARGPDRAAGAAIFTIVLVWALHAGVDWDWELPVTTVPVLVLAGAALGRHGTMPAAIASPPALARLLAGLGCLLVAITPVLVYVSQHRLDAAMAAYGAGDCPTAIDRALASSRVLGVRPEPLAVLGICDVRIGEPRLGVRAVESALSRDPRSWSLAYELALLRASAGQDPRPAAREALRRNPRSPLTQDAVKRFDSSDPAVWRRRAAGARPPF